MDLDELKNSIKEYIDTRLKSPYFATVLFVWVYINRTLIFGVLNFTENLTFQERVSWARQQINIEHTILFTTIKYSGLTYTLIYSLTFAFLAMSIYNILNTISKIVYNYIELFSTSLLRRIKESNYVPRNEYNKVLKRSLQNENSISEIQNTNSTLRERSEELLNDNKIKENELLELRKELKNLKEIKSEIENEKNRFTIIHAQYGKYNRFVEVTKMLSDNLRTRSEIEITNDFFNIDPYPFKIKELLISYRINGKESNITAQENEIIKFVNNEIIIEKTTNSITKQTWLGNQVQLSHELSGRWEYIKIVDGIPMEKEEFKIDNFGNYLVNEAVKYNIQVPIFELPRNITVRKINQMGDIQEEEKMQKINLNLFEGYNFKNEKIQYRKLDPQ